MTLQDGLAEQDLLVAFLEGGEGGRRAVVAGGQIVIEGLETLLEGVVIAFIVTAGIGDVRPRGR